MKFAINLNPILPVRAESKDASEQTSQLLFGEYCQIIENEHESFVKIINKNDGYKGWVSKNMLTEIDSNEYKTLCEELIYRTCVPMAEVFCMSNKSIVRLTAGSLLPHYEKENSTCQIADKRYQIHPDFVTFLPGKNRAGIIPTAHMFLNTPYMWGGKNIFGIDCSGFTQTVFSINGITLERDASEQVKQGEAIDAFEDALPNDLLFFEKNKTITHVGIYLGENRLIHASGHVHIDNIDERGIHILDKKYTHHLATIRRI